MSEQENIENIQNQENVDNDEIIESNAPPKEENKCDSCGGELIIRKDDRKDVVESRLETYHRETEPLKAFYNKLGLLEIVDGEGKVEDVSLRAFDALGVMSK
jgi:adenylate kinase